MYSFEQLIVQSALSSSLTYYIVSAVMVVTSLENMAPSFVATVMPMHIRPFPMHLSTQNAHISTSDLEVANMDFYTENYALSDDI